MHLGNSLKLIWGLIWIFLFSLPSCGTNNNLHWTFPNQTGATATPNADGTVTVTVTGSGFVAGITVTVNGTPCVSVKVKSWSSLTCILPNASIPLTNIVFVGTSKAAFLDTFTADDGTLIGNHIANTGQSWVVTNGTPVILSNLFAIGPSDLTGVVSADVNIGISDFTLTADLNLKVYNTNTHPTIYFREVDSQNYWFASIANQFGVNYFQIQEVTGGASTPRASLTRSYTTGTKQWSVTVSGTSISTTYDGSTLTFASSSHQTGTGIGLKVTGASGDFAFGNLKVMPP